MLAEVVGEGVAEMLGEGSPLTVGVAESPSASAAGELVSVSASERDSAARSGAFTRDPT